MGYLNNSTITVDAILTKKGRELLARNRNEFKITQFALSDDEIDYDLRKIKKKAFKFYWISWFFLFFFYNFFFIKKTKKWSIVFS